MAESLDDLLAKTESGFSVMLQNTPANNESLSKIQHLIEKDPSLYQYVLLKESADTSARQIIQYEHASNMRAMINYFKEFERKDKETKMALYTIIEQHGKDIKAMKIMKYVLIGQTVFSFTIGFWGLYTINPDAGEAVIKFIKALGSIF
jgi:hypothetical protein|nr:MAG TPA: hypothetical protein [Caudoviricetes sp.]